MAPNASIITLQSDFIQIINGRAAATQYTRHGINPCNRRPLPEVPLATENDVNNAINSGKMAFNSWSTVSYQERKCAVLSYADAVAELARDFQELLTSEQGKPSTEAEIEVAVALQWLRELAEIPLPEELLEDTAARTIIARYVPIGVTAALIPWNSPVLLAAVKIAMAVLTGNVVIVKPSPYTPYTGLKLVEVAQLFFPPGVIQSLSGDDDLGKWIARHPGIGMISFTGSTETGKKVMQSASNNLTRITLELGGNDAAIIFPDIDIEAVAKKVAMLAFVNCGQTCVAIKRIYAHSLIYTPFRAALVRRIEEYRTGDGSQPGVSLGPLQNDSQYQSVKGLFDEIEKEGWSVATGGQIKSSPGYFISPTLIDNPPDDSAIVREEPFGPIVPLMSWDTEDDVIQRANNSAMGLGASVWSNNLDQAQRVARRMQAGSVWVNDHFNLSPIAPFGGHKCSGIGSEGGLQGLKGFCNVQVLNLNKLPC